MSFLQVVKDAATSTSRRLLRSRVSPIDAIQYPGLFGRLHRCDFMIGGTTDEFIAHYKRVGEQAFSLSAEAATLAGKRIEDSKAVLDFGCGYGRVTRVVAQKLRPHRVSAFDVDNGAGMFCGKEFGVKAVPFDGDWEHVPWGRYDVIWVGSVLTHLSKRETRRMLALLSKIAAPGGVIVFTTHGEEALKRLERGDYGPRFQTYTAEVKQHYAEDGFSFLPFVQEEVAILPAEYEIADFGMTWMTQPYVQALMQDISGGQLDLLKFVPAGWDYHQDVWMYRKP